jgi:uncharacterized repeat protein (TIGR02543 family)
MRKYAALLLSAAMTLLSACPNLNDDENPEPAPEGKTTSVCFVNDNDFSITVYSDSSRLSKLADVPANSQSDPIQTTPDSNAVFYLTYHIPIEEFAFPYNGSALPVRIDAGKTTTVSIPLLADLDADELAKPVTTGVHIKMQNAGTSGLVLRRGSYEENPQGASSAIVNAGETVHYLVNSGPVSSYSFMKNTITPVPFPDSLTEFTAGHFYSLKFNGNAIILAADRPITIAEALKTVSGYTVTFDADGGSPAKQTLKVQRGGTVGSNMPSDPTWASYSYAFDGWYTLQNGSGSQFTGSTPVTGDITVYAKWTATYTVTFNADGGSPDTQTRAVQRGGTVGSSNMPPEPTKSGYIFDGWYTSQNGFGSQFTDSTAVSRSRTVYANWAAVYTITFDADGGSPETQTGEVKMGETVGSSNMPPEPTKSGYIFDGWYTSRNGFGSQFTDSTPVTGDITVYAKWTPVYTVTFNADGGSPDMQTKTVKGGEALGSSNMPPEPTKSGYIFDGWYTEGNGGGSQFTGSTVANGDITVYAKWMPVYTVTFNADGGSPDTQTQVVKMGGTVGSLNMPSDPTRSGYIFGGWYTEGNGGGSQFTDSTAVNGDITVYAKWTPVYTVTFNADGGNPDTQTRVVEIGGTVGSSNMPPSPTRSHHVFGGWYTSSGGNGNRFTASTKVTGDITVYAKWVVVLYTVTFDADGGSPEPQPQKVNGGEVIGSSNMPSEPAMSGYAFDGWYTEGNGGGSQFTASTPVTGDIRVYAKWKPGVPVQIALQPQPGDPPLSNTSLYENEQIQFSAAGTGYMSWQWYWQGRLISGANSSIYTLTANSKSPGIYEVAVVVITNRGAKLSARCRVTIKAR